MRLNAEVLQELCEQAKNAAVAAGQYIESVDRSQLAVEHKATGNSLASLVVTEVDRECERIIRDTLRESCRQYDLALLSEESAEDHAREIKNRFTQNYFWCVDPLDGTLPFTQGKPGYAVSIALVSKSGTPMLGVVYDPVTRDLFHALDVSGFNEIDASGFHAKEGCGAFKNGQRLSIPSKPAMPAGGQSTLTVFADHSFKDDPCYPQLQSQLKRAATELVCDGVTEVYGNGAVKNACGLFSDAPTCYLKRPKATEGGGSLWDLSATACIIKAAGGWVSDFNGQPLDLNPRGSTFMNQHGILFASSAEVARAIIGLDVSGPRA